MTTVPLHPDKPELAFRVGVTGARAIDPSHQPWVEAGIHAVLATIREEIARLAKEPRVITAYAMGDVRPPVPRLTFLSPLAQGADRLAARAAVAAGYDLFIPLPFRCADDTPEAQYRAQYSKHEAPYDPTLEQEFTTLLRQADGRVLTLDGDRPQGPLGDLQEARSFEAVGNFIVRNCDLLIAIWDGRSSRGWGGTGAMVRLAANGGPPVWWIHATEPVEPRLIRTFLDVYGKLPIKDAGAGLRDYLRETIMPPRVDTAHEHHGPIASIINFRRGPVPDPITQYFSDPLPRQPRGMKAPDTDPASTSPIRPPPLFRAHVRLLRILSARPLKAWYHGGKQELTAAIRRAAGRSPSAPGSSDPWQAPVDYWRRHYAFADERAEANGHRYRSVYVWIFITIALSLIAATGAMAMPVTWPLHTPLEALAILVEALGLIFIFWLLYMNGRKDWHQRWIDCRLLAEMCRGQRSVARLGWTLPIGTLYAMASSRPASRKHGARLQSLPRRLAGQLWRWVAGSGSADHDHHGDTHERPAWVAWLFLAMLRAAPLPTGTFDKVRLVETRETINRELIRDQWVYNRRTARRLERAAARLARWGETFFLVLVIIIAWKAYIVFQHLLHSLLPHPPPTPPAEAHQVGDFVRLLGFAAVALPTMAAASVGIRAYAELTLLARRSRSMAAVMRRWHRHVARVNPGDPVASADLGEATHTVVSEMLLETDGWAHTFRIKVPEAG